MEADMMHQNFIEQIIKESQRNTEMLLEMYFRIANDDITEEEISQILLEVSKNMFTTHTEIAVHL